MSAFLVKFRIPIRKLQIPLPELDGNLEESIARRCGVPPNSITDYEIIHKSLDARKKPDLFLNYQAVVNFHPRAMLKLRNAEAWTSVRADYLSQLKDPACAIRNPLVVGTGPAGLFAALLLAECGCAPLIIDRGSPVAERETAIKNLFAKRELDPDNNFLFGEGGAGTYSDGKLYTRGRDPRNRFVLETFVKAGAQTEILYEKRPHLGSDRLPQIVTAIRERIEARGGMFRWQTRVSDLKLDNGSCRGVVLDDGEIISAPVTLLAPGLSARNLLRNLIGQLDFAPKGFQLGCRIEHSQAFINQTQLGCDPPPEGLGSAEYSLTSRPPSGAGQVTSFCMCPGGEIIPATHLDGQLSTNGMSRLDRNGNFANAGLIVNRDAAAFDSPLAALDYLDDLERRVFSAGGGEFRVPAQGALAFVQGESELPECGGSYRLGMHPGRLDQLLPPPVTKAIRAALIHFEKLIPGFMTSGILVGAESRISSPVRFLRHPDTLETSASGLYITGKEAVAQAESCPPPSTA